MSRSADYTIQGFLFQFNKTLLEILKGSDDNEITVEGIIEDIEICSLSGITAIQCKYHEASEKFNPSSIFKPLLQMMDYYHKNSTAEISYILYAHYPDMKGFSDDITNRMYLETALTTNDKELQKYIVTLRDHIDLDGFVSSFRLEFGPSFDELIRQVHLELENNGISKDDIDILAYPNAVNIIAGISIKHDPRERRIAKHWFLAHLKSIHKTAISRWTLALSTRKKILEARRKQLKTNLDKNTRLRYFVIDPSSLKDYDTEVVLFISDYLERYHFKLLHTDTPLICLRTTEVDFRDIQHRLYTKGIISTDGYIGAYFEESLFFRPPLSCKDSGCSFKREFDLRLLRWDEHNHVLNNNKCDDLFIIGDCDCSTLNTVNVNVEFLEAETFKEIKYLLGVNNACE